MYLADDNERMTDEERKRKQRQGQGQGQEEGDTGMGGSDYSNM